MADILMISATVVQFLDVAIRLSGKLGGLYIDLRDVPAELQSLKLDIDQQIDIARCIQSSHATFLNAPHANSIATTSIDQTLASYVSLMERLIELLQSVTNKDNARIAQRSWNAVRAVHKRKEIMTICANLERKKSTVGLWLSNAKLQLLMSIQNLLAEVQINACQTLQLTKTIEKASSRANQQLDSLSSLTRPSAAIASVLTRLETDTSSNQKQLLDITNSNSASLRALLSQWEELTPTFHQFRNIVERLSQLPSLTHELSSGSQVRPVSGGDTCMLKLNDAYYRSSVPIRGDSAQTHTACTCSQINRATTCEPLAFLQFKRVFRKHHYRRCPKSKNAEISIEFLMKVIPPAWLLRHTFNFGFSLHYWRLGGGWKISPFIIGTSRLVDSKASPAFRAIQPAIEFASRGELTAPSQLQAIVITLKDMFACGQASVLDEDQDGHTILYEILRAYLLIGRHHNTCLEFLSLIRFLLEQGADPNVHRKADDGEREFIPVGGTALDMFAPCLVYDYSPHFRREYVTFREIYDHLVASGAHFSRPLTTIQEVHSDYMFQHFNEEIEQLLTFDEQLEVCDLSDLIVSILRRDEEAFTRALVRDDLEQACHMDGLTPLHFATYWPWALQQLIAAGVDINCEDNYGRRPIHLAVACGQMRAAEMLLQADCSIYTPQYSRGLLQESLRQDYGQMSNWIIDALIDRHTRLINLTIALSPNHPDVKEHLNESIISETRGPESFESLTKSGYHVPPALELDRDGKSVYDTASFDADIRLTVSIANRLWNGGFKRINEFSTLNDLSPLLQSWFIADFDMISWFIEKGVSPFSKDGRGSHTGLHLYAARLASPGRFFGNNIEKVPTDSFRVQQLIDHSDLWHDSCHCLCSTSGCTPTSIVVSHSWAKLVRMRKNDYHGMRHVLKCWKEKMVYQPHRYPDHAPQLLRAMLFEKMRLKHTCSRIGNSGESTLWDSWTPRDRRDYGNGNLTVQFQQNLEEALGRMIDCRCDATYKPLCVLFFNKCIQQHPSASECSWPEGLEE
ncbi:hypothetical protein F5Y07DRAFT_327944 [Xylaria sp. FL0933]|nr:hypothetical protein F5Y07DRAFT_327944 [Xylaria sp. FL0933]